MRVGWIIGVALLLATSALAAGVRDRNGDGRTVVVCVGDSNTDDLYPLLEVPKWCTLLGGADGLTVVNLAVGGAHAFEGTGWDGPSQLRRARAYRPDAVVIALGTNDVRAGRPVEQVLGDLAVLARQADALGAVPWMATIPPNYEAGQTADQERVRREVNAGLRQAHPDTVLEFDQGFGPADAAPDGLHVSAAAQVRRARLATDRLLGGP